MKHSLTQRNSTRSYNDQNCHSLPQSYADITNPRDKDQTPSFINNSNNNMMQLLNMMFTRFEQTIERMLDKMMDRMIDLVRVTAQKQK